MDCKPDPNDELTEQDWEEMRKRDAEIDAAFSVAPAELRAAYNSANRISEFSPPTRRTSPRTSTSSTSP